MNYFGHAAVASLRWPDPGFLFGAMLPDLVAMSETPLPQGASDALAGGLRFHQETDALFHRTETFVGHNCELVRSLRTAGVRRGPARAAAHIGVEMLIDATLAEDEEFLAAYRASLAWAVAAPEATEGLSSAEETRLRALCKHLHVRSAAVFQTSAERLAFRLGRTLRPRPRLAPTDEELQIIGSVCSRSAEPVARSVPHLLTELSPLTDPAPLPTGTGPRPG